MFRQVSQEALLALELFRLSPASKKTQELMHQHLVEAAMHNEPEAKSVPKITIAVLNILGQPSGFSEDECEKAIVRCCELGRISASGSNTYVLSDVVRAELDTTCQEFMEAEIRFNKRLVETVGRTLDIIISPLAEPLLCAAVRDTIQEMFYKGAMRLQKLLSSECDFSLFIQQDDETESALRERLKTFVQIQRGAVLDDTLHGVRFFLGLLDGLQRRYVASFHRRVFYFQMLNVDPRLQDLERECFRNMKIYLDTNVAIQYLCEGTRLHQPIFDILEATKFLGVNLFVSPATFGELQHLVDEADKFSIYLKDGRIAKVMQVSLDAMDNPVIDGFVKLRRDRPKLNWEAYISPLRNLEEYMISRDILVEKECSEDIENDNAYQDAYKEISAVKIGTDLHIIRHDASNFALIHRLRNKYPGTPLGSAVWLLTVDKKLPRVDELLHSKYSGPHCQLIQQWGELLINFQNVGKFIATDDYVAYLASQRLGAYIVGETLDIQVFEALANTEVLSEKILTLEPEIACGVIRDVQKDREARLLLGQMKTATAEEKLEIEDKLATKTTDLTTKHMMESVEAANREIARLKRGVTELSDELRGQESANKAIRQTIETLNRDLEAAQKQIHAFHTMPFFVRLKYLFGLRQKS